MTTATTHRQAGTDLQARKELERKLIHLSPVIDASMYQYIARHCTVDQAMQPAMVTGAVLNYKVKAVLCHSDVDAWRLDAGDEVRPNM